MIAPPHPRSGEARPEARSGHAPRPSPHGVSGARGPEHPDRRGADPAPRVLFFQHSNRAGGAPRSLLQIARRFEEEFGPQTVLFIRPGPVLATYAGLRSRITCGRVMLPFHGSEVSGMDWKLALRNILGLLVVPGAYLRRLRNYDVLYLNSSSLCFYGLIAKTLSPRARVIYHIREPLLANAWGGIIRWAIRASQDRVLAISRHELANLALPEAKGEVVYNYVESADYRVEKGNSLHRKDPRVGPRAFSVGYFARLDRKNGIADFLEIARRFEGDSEMAFCVYGCTGGEAPDVKALLAAAGPNVHLYPMVSDVPPNLGDLDVLLVPFAVPHFSRSVIEAAILGVPSIIYDIPSVNETVRDGETGHVVPPGDARAMGDRLAELRRAPEDERARLAAGARALAAREFSEKNYLRIRDAIIGK